MSEKYLGEVSTPLLINQIKENCAQKRTALPIASVDELGNTYQYTGTTSGSLVHGYFYECVSDGQDPVTYSWQQVNIQPSAGTPTAATTTFDNTISGLQATNVQDGIDEVDSKVDNIEGKIPSTATSSNKLVDHDSLGTAAFKDFTPNVAPNNHNLVESNAVYNAITTALTSVYTPRGDLSCAELTSSLLVAANVGNIYEMSDSGTTSALFLQGAGVTINVGDNVGIIQTGVSEYKFNLMANAFDMTDYQKKTLTNAVEGQTTVEGALGALETAINAISLSAIQNALHPIGSVYLTIGNTNPATLLGFGTWTALSEGYLKTGGSSASGGSLTTGSHALTVGELPSHNHTIAHTHSVSGNTGAMSGNATGIVRFNGLLINENTGAQIPMLDNASGNLSLGVTTTSYLSPRYDVAATDASALRIDVSHTHPINLTSGDPSNANSGNTGSGNGHTHTIEPTYTRIYAWQRTA